MCVKERAIHTNKKWQRTKVQRGTYPLINKSPKFFLSNRPISKLQQKKFNFFRILIAFKLSLPTWGDVSPPSINYPPIGHPNPAKGWGGGQGNMKTISRILLPSFPWLYLKESWGGGWRRYRMGGLPPPLWKCHNHLIKKLVAYTRTFFTQKIAIATLQLAKRERKSWQVRSNRLWKSPERYLEMATTPSKRKKTFKRQKRTREREKQQQKEDDSERAKGDFVAIKGVDDKCLLILSRLNKLKDKNKFRA